MSWHRNVTMRLVRTFFEDRDPRNLLGSAPFFEHEDAHFVEFQYKQSPWRGLNWMASPKANMALDGHVDLLFEPWFLYTNSFLELPEDKRIAHKIHKIDFVFARVGLHYVMQLLHRLLEEILE